MADFWKAIPVILHHEGGLADNPKDPGGVTNFGWSFRFFANNPALVQRWFGHPSPVRREDIVSMTRDRAIEMYREIIWNPNRYQMLNDDIVATKIFDATINMGEKWGETLAQQAANRFNAHLKVDGELGPVSIAAINALPPVDFVDEYCWQMKERYQQIIAHNPDLAVFQSNWFKRAAWNGR